MFTINNSVLNRTEQVLLQTLADRRGMQFITKDADGSLYVHQSHPCWNVETGEWDSDDDNLLLNQTTFENIESDYNLENLSLNLASARFEAVQTVTDYGIIAIS